MYIYTYIHICVYVYTYTCMNGGGAPSPTDLDPQAPPQPRPIRWYRLGRGECRGVALLPCCTTGGPSAPRKDQIDRFQA